MGINRNIHRPIKEDYICSDKQAAVIRLNKYPVYSGRPVVERYYSNPEKTWVDVIFAIGIKNDESGPDSYRLVCSEGILLTTDIVYEYPDVTFEELCIPFNFPTLRTKAKFCAIPSTSGTATEVTAFSVITDYENGIKYPLADFNITPDVAIVDPDLAEKMPPKLTAHTGMDAMTHAIEAYVSTLHCDYTDPLALHAIKMIHNDLIKSYNGDMEARDRMHNAQCLAGMAFSNALLGIVHSMAHKTGAAYSGGHIVHGCANAMYLPKVIKYNSKNPEAAVRYGEIAAFIGLKGDSTEALVDALIKELKSMNEALNIPKCIKDYEGGIIDEAEFNSKLSDVAALAISDACTGSNPRIPTQEELEKLLDACFYDKEIDF